MFRNHIHVTDIHNHITEFLNIPNKSLTSLPPAGPDAGAAKKNGVRRNQGLRFLVLDVDLDWRGGEVRKKSRKKR